MKGKTVGLWDMTCVRGGGCLKVSCWICSDAGEGAGDRQLQSYAAQLHKLAHTQE